MHSYVAATAACLGSGPHPIPEHEPEPEPEPESEARPYAGRSRRGSSSPPAGALCRTGCTCSSARCRTCHPRCSTPPSRSSRSSPPHPTRLGSRSWQPYATDGSKPGLAAASTDRPAAHALEPCLRQGGDKQLIKMAQRCEDPQLLRWSLSVLGSLAADDWSRGRQQRI
jgi:hypothetical protein